MKVRIKSVCGELPEYLTMSKEYRVSGRNVFNEFLIRDDNRNRIYIHSSTIDHIHLNGGSWEIINEN